MFKKILLIPLLVLMLVGCKFNNPVGPDVPGPEPVKYDLEVTYIRINVSRPDLLYRTPSFTIYLITSSAKQSIASLYFSQRIDDYTFKGEISDIQSNDKQGLYAIYVVDSARYDGLNKGSIAIGDRIILRVKQTNFEKELKDIRINSIYPYVGAKMACFVLTSDGKIISDPQTY